jgi:hypothetical protein
MALSMNKKIMAILFAMLMSATMFAGIATVTAEESFNEDDIEWTTIYIKTEDGSVASGGLRGTEPYTDLEVYRVQIGQVIGCNYFRVKYYLECDAGFTHTFKDRLWIDDYSIQDYQHSSMDTGINGMYYSQWFQVNGKGYHDITVYTDYDPNLNNGVIQEYDEGNNDKTISYNFQWIG